MTRCSRCNQELGVLRDGWRITDRAASYRGAEMPLTKQQVDILRVIAAADGKIVSVLQIAQAVGHASQPDNLVKVQFSKMREVLGRMFPVENVWGRGYRWSAI